MPSFMNHIHSSALFDPPTKQFLDKSGFYYLHLHIRKLRSWEVMALPRVPTNQKMQ